MKVKTREMSALEGQQHQVVGDRQVIVEIVGHAERRRGALRHRGGARFHAIELLFDVADVGQVLVEDRVVGRTERAAACRAASSATESSMLCFRRMLARRRLRRCRSRRTCARTSRAG